MATATVNNQAGTNGSGLASENIVIEREDLVVGTEGTTKVKQGDKEVEVPVAVFYTAEAVAKEEFKKDHPEFKEGYRVTAQRSKPRNYAGIQEIFGDSESEAASCAYNGAKQKISNKLNKRLLDMDEEGNFTFLEKIDTPESPLSNGVYDLDALAREKPGRTSLTEDEKMVRALQNFPDAVALATYNAWRTSQGMAAVASFPRS